jgi:hypothetical protein
MQTEPAVSLQKRALEQTRAFVIDLAAHCTYELTLHTRMRVAGISTHSRQQRVYRAQAVMRYFQPRFLRAIAGNTWRRYAHRVPVFIPSLEGINSDRDKLTLHWHVLIGNITGIKNAEHLHSIAHHIWTAHDDAGTDTEAQPLYYARGFGGYAAKELTTFNYDCIDYGFLQAPAHIIDRLPCCS